MATVFPTRRAFLAAAATLAAASTVPARMPSARRCVFVLLTGGPSQLDTFDPKPDARAEVRGPFRAIRTRVPGIHFTELLPLLAERADRVAVVRSVHHAEPPLHEAGLQLLQTGRFVPRGDEFPHVGALSARAVRGPWHLLPGRLGDTGLAIGRGQSTDEFGSAYAPVVAGNRDFVANCRRAVRLIESGATFVGINSYTTLFDTVSWDCHADGGRLATTLDDYRESVVPAFDRGFATLLDGLSERGLLDSTLVVAAGEFGRTPFVNPRGGRDHWAGCWSVLFAGGGVRGGQFYGASDRLGAEPADRPVTPANIAATVLHVLGVSGHDIDAAPLRDLFG